MLRKKCLTVRTGYGKSSSSFHTSFVGLLQRSQEVTTRQMERQNKTKHVGVNSHPDIITYIPFLIVTSI